MAMVMPRARSSGALSIESKLRNSASPLRASTLVIAAVSVVLPWSMWPMVPTLTCGLVRSNFFFAIARSLSPGPSPAGEGSIPGCPLADPREQALTDIHGNLLVMVELDGVGRSPLRHRAEISCVAEQLRQRYQS